MDLFPGIDLVKGPHLAGLETRLESPGQPGRPEQSLASHRRIADAIRLQNPEAAAAAMLEHIDLVSDVALLK
ncbi:DNA-binding FadR family transcriptional regulator [Arthrobacter pascens]|nr:DNA-binding FadR family transcriptional regulator [Arthrobacter pascens]